MVKPRQPEPILKFIDSYCELYQYIFPCVSSFENFKYLHLGLISELKRKTLPEIAQVAGLDNEQSLHHFLTKSPWLISDLRNQRLEIILKVLQGREIIIIIDEKGSKKKGKKTDYVKRQYIGNLGKVEQGMVAVTAYGYIEGITFPLIFEIYKPKEKLKEGDIYKSKPEIACDLIKDLQKKGFNFSYS
jgi:SRSO17 transposase